MIKKVLNDRLVNRTRFLGQLKMISYASGRDNGMRQWSGLKKNGVGVLCPVLG